MKHACTLTYNNTYSKTFQVNLRNWIWVIEVPWCCWGFFSLFWGFVLLGFLVVVGFFWVLGLLIWLVHLVCWGFFNITATWYFIKFIQWTRASNQCQYWTVKLLNCWTVKQLNCRETTKYWRTRFSPFTILFLRLYFLLPYLVYSSLKISTGNYYGLSIMNSTRLNF